MRKIVYIFFICLFVAPLMQQFAGIPQIKELFGAYTSAKLDSLTFDSWFSGSFQEKTDAYLNEKFGYRSSLVRIHNQLQYSLFNEAHARGVVVGKQDYLYELNYIKAYYGTDFKGLDYIHEQVRKLAAVRDTLHSLGVELLPILACGKGAFFPEFIPDSMRSEKKTTNYDVFTSEFKRYNINYIDFHSYIRSQKGKFKYPIYTKYGIHWSQYTVVKVADSLLTYIDNVYYYSMPQLVLNNVDETYILQGSDYDIAKGMNLMYYKSDSLLGYPKFSYNLPDSVKKPKVITISDSYWWGIYGYGITQKCFESHQFWYYFNEAYVSGLNKPLKVSELDLKNEIEKHNIICIMATDATLPKYGWGFIDAAYDIYIAGKENQ